MQHVTENIGLQTNDQVSSRSVSHYFCHLAHRLLSMEFSTLDPQSSEQEDINSYLADITKTLFGVFDKYNKSTRIVGSQVELILRLLVSTL